MLEYIKTIFIFLKTILFLMQSSHKINVNVSKNKKNESQRQT